MKTTAAEIGECIRTTRLRRRLSLVQLASRLGMDQGNLSRIEKGQTGPPKLATLARIALALGTTPERLLR